MLQLHFIAVADWWTAAQTTDKHLYPLPGCKKTTKQQNIMGLSQCLLSNLQTSCKWRAAWELTECLTVVTCLRVWSSASEANFKQSGSDAQALLHGEAALLYSVHWRNFSLEGNLDVLLECSHLLKWPARWCCLISSIKGRRAAQNHETHSRMCLWWENVCELGVTAVSRCYDGRN